MIIAEQKKKENIIEYILYMRQIQEIIRANSFDINKIDNLIINKYDVTNSVKDDIRNWFSNLILEMKKENIEKHGDLQSIKILITELTELHNKLLKSQDGFKHQELFRWAKSYISEYRNLSKANNESDIEICINAVNSLLLLRLKQQSISDETAHAMQTFTNLLANLSLNYHKTNTQ